LTGLASDPGCLRFADAEAIYANEHIEFSVQLDRIPKTWQDAHEQEEAWEQFEVSLPSGSNSEGN